MFIYNKTGRIFEVSSYKDFRLKTESSVVGFQFSLLFCSVEGSHEICMKKP